MKYEELCSHIVHCQQGFRLRCKRKGKYLFDGKQYCKQHYEIYLRDEIGDEKK